MRKLTTLFIALGGLALSLPMHSETTEVYFSDPSATRVNYGYLNYAGHHDAAVFIPGDGYAQAGAVVTKMEMEVAVHEMIDNYRIWIATTLTNPGEGVEFEGSIFNVDVEPTEVNAAGTRAKIVYTLPEPYKVPETGFYAGFSFDVRQLTADYDTKRPFMFTSEDNGCQVYTRLANISPEWQYVAGASSPYRVTMEAEEFPKGMAIMEGKDVMINRGEPVDVVVNVVNRGVTHITDVEYSYTLNGETKTGKERVNLAPRIGAFKQLTFNLEGFAEGGAYPMDFNVTKVDDKDNPLVEETGTVKIDVLAQFPKKRPVMEEYTGTWCGWCTRGTIGMRVCRERIPDFIGIAYHGGDIMELKTGNPGQVSGYPKAYIDRTVEADPYFGTTANDPAHIITDYLAKAEELTPADIKVEAKWNEAEDGILITSVTNFWLEPKVSDPYRIAYVIVQDGLTGKGSQWAQVNYYGDGAGTATGDLAELRNWGSMVANMVYDDVAVWSSGPRGISGSVPALEDIEVGKDYVHEYEAPLSKFLTRNELPSYQGTNNMRVVALLLNLESTYCRVENAAMFEIPGQAGVDTLQVSPAEPVGVEYYDFSGRKVSNPATGLYIKVVRMSDGTNVSSKVSIK